MTYRASEGPCEVALDGAPAAGRRLPCAWQVGQPARGGDAVGLDGGLALWARAFPGIPRHAGSARRFVAGLLDGSPFCDDAAVVLSELFTNALLHTASGGPGGLVIVQVTRWRHGVRIAVTDQGSSAEPVIRDPACLACQGRVGMACTWPLASPSTLAGTTMPRGVPSRRS